MINAIYFIQERTQAGLKAARTRGRLGGRPPLLRSEEVKKMTVNKICKLFNMSRPSFYHYLKKWQKEIPGIEKPETEDV